MTWQGKTFGGLGCQCHVSVFPEFKRFKRPHSPGRLHENACAVATPHHHAPLRGGGRVTVRGLPISPERRAPASHLWHNHLRICRMVESSQCKDYQLGSTSSHGVDFAGNASTWRRRQQQVRPYPLMTSLQVRDAHSSRDNIGTTITPRVGDPIKIINGVCHSLVLLAPSRRPTSFSPCASFARQLTFFLLSLQAPPPTLLSDTHGLEQGTFVYLLVHHR